ncbi:esterase-like activity of phytase family protein [Sulfurovum sp. zt1-1]|uniref:Esterase-like activity of phytase family protein n=1 Tax=Sulfurovum zhangzhouensis TaxID=3019067 RepID=A0ABT7R048_9BACT|nr:esterase-like activity of phytase family protein [Sulfurovum zhangzhouensis]MDM5272440.1 esterase-like activity of phytase family protein [Sulfurovum zhangzhouensis]
MKLILILFAFFSVLYAEIRSVDITPRFKSDQYSGIKILDQKYLSYKQIGGYGFSELSDLTYDPKEKKLFMISDEGRLFTFHAMFSDKIDVLKPISATLITKENGKKFKKWRRDSEGICLGAKGGLLISFEGKPRLGLFREDGQRIKTYTLPKPLRNAENYRSQNKSLEALARHPWYGALMVAEWPLKKDHKKYQTIYSLSGKQWHFTAEPEARSSTTAIEVMDDGNILVLERSFTDYLDPFVITLKKVYLEGCTQNSMCKSKVLVKMNSHKGWDVDNFEGLAHVGNNRFVMISDDNDNFFQRTLLIYFEVTE